MKDLIEMLVEQALDELLEPQEPTVYFDMDGVLADFDKKAHSYEHVEKARQELRAFMAQRPDIAKLHNDDLKELLRGRQEDPYLAKLKKLYNKHSDSIYSVADKSGYFISLEPMPGALAMIHAAAELTGKKPHVLTAPMQRNPSCEEEKREWIDKHIGSAIDQFHCTKEKQNFANSEWDILIDDRPKYINKFRGAGGTAIMHKGDPAATIAELEETIARLKGMNEVNAISVGGAALQSSGKVSGTGGNPLGRDMKPEHERMWSGDEEGSDRVNEAIRPQKVVWLSINDLEPNEFQSPDEFYPEHVERIADKLEEGWDLSIVPPILAFAASPKWVVHDGHHRFEAARQAGLGKVPVLNFSAMSRGEKAAYTRQKKSWRKHISHPLLDEERIGSRGSVDYFQMGSSLPDHLYNLDSKGRATRDPGLGGNTDKKKKKKREKKKKVKDRPGKRWYDK